MNLRYFYYHSCFEGVDLRQPEQKTDRLTLEKRNEPVLKAKNKTLCTAQPPVAPSLNLANLATTQLSVQNPGLLPGVGYPHEIGYAGEFKLGFHFDFTTGLPALPGSTVKGVIRSVFPQYQFDEKTPLAYKPEDKREEAELQQKKAAFVCKLLQSVLPADVVIPQDTRDFCHQLELAVFEGWDLASLPGTEPTRLPMSKHAVFFDALPVKFDRGLLGRDAITPHHNSPLKNPTPLPFVKVLPGVTFEFNFRLPDLMIGDTPVSAQALQQLFVQILQKTGLGAKTNVGYGQVA